METALELRRKVMELTKYIQSRTDVKVDGKTAILREQLQGEKYNMMSLDRLQFPHEPDYKVTGVIPDRCNVFKSAVQPQMLTFNCVKSDGTQCQMSSIWKRGDDIRQDQMVMQLMTVMDAILKEKGLDYQFTLYKCLGCTNEDGVMEMVTGAKTVQKIRQDFKDDLGLYLSGLSDDKAKVQKAYMDSCAGYAIATYLLAVGDRHLENLLVTKTGHMFHCDFGFILGKNPPKKDLFVPEIRINKPMIAGMGGQSDPNYQKFKTLATDGFIELRKNRLYLLNLVALMVDAQIKDLPSSDYFTIL